MFDSPEFDDGRLTALLAVAKDRSRALGRRQRFRYGATGMAALALVLGSAGTFVLSQSGAGTDHRAANSGGHPTLVRTPSWRLVGDVSQPSWQEQPPPTPSGRGYGLVCPTATTCYMQQEGQAPITGTLLTSVEVTLDGGSTWQESSLPSGDWTSTGLACPAAETCMAGGSDSDGNAVFLATDDGGESWTALPGPDQLGSSFLFLGVSCATGQSCVAVGEAQAAGEGGAQTYDVVVTTDGGQSWSDSPLPAGFVPGEVQCLASERCIVGGFDAPFGSAPPSQGAGLYSIDGGSTWTAASVPAGVGPITTVSCSDEVDCVAVTSGATSLLTSRVVVTADGGQTWTAAAATGLSGDFLQDVSCPTASYCWAAGIQIPAGPGGPDPTPIALSSVQGTLAMTDDGGQTWQAAQLPTDLSNHSVVTGAACPTSTSCFATVWLPTASLQGGRYVLLSYDSSGS